MEALVALFSHTADGSEALKDLLAAGVAPAAIQVIGDLGAPAGTPGAMPHVTLDILHIPQQQRARFMEGIRSGGVVLAVRDAADLSGVERTLNRHGALLIERTTLEAPNPSHNL